MNPKTLVMTAALAGLVLALPMQALAAGPPEGKGERGAEARAEHGNMSAAKRAALDSFHENRTRILQEYHDALAAIRASWHENKTRVLAACRGVGDGEHGNNSAMSNLSKEERLAYAHCVRDGLAPLKNATRADMRDAREAAHDALKAAREAVKATYRAARAGDHGGA
jgi:hypothetical protein